MSGSQWHHMGYLAHFCLQLNCDPLLRSIEDLITLLQVFAHRYHTGQVAPSGAAVHSWMVEGALCAMGQMFVSLGSPDTRLQTPGKLDLRLSRQLSVYSKQDPPPLWVKPIPFPVISHTIDMCRWAHTNKMNTTAEILILGFFFLLHPGEYAYSLNHVTCTTIELTQVNYITLEFTSQKKGVWGELISQSTSGHPTWCPVKALINQIKHLRTHNAPKTTPLYTFYDRHQCTIDNTTFTFQLRLTTTVIGAAYGISAVDISIRSWRASGAMALLCARVDTDIIHLLGCWRSNEMLRYLHVQAFPLLALLATQMLQNGNFHLMPNLPMWE